MGKNLRLSIFGLTLAVLITLMISSARADIYFVDFIAPTYEGLDGFYRTNVVAYRAGSNVTLVIAVNNSGFDIGGYHYDEIANVSAVGVRFDWMAPHTYINSTECSSNSPYELEYEGYHTFIIQFTLPTVPTTLNLVSHRFEIIVVNIASITDPNVRQDIIWTWSGGDFAVYSADQADAQELYQELWDKMYYYLYQIYFYQFEARMLSAEALIERSAGSTDYERGDFTNAKMHLQRAFDLVDQALKIEESGLKASAEMEYSSMVTERDYTDSLIDYYDSLTDATKKEGEAAMAQAEAAKTQANAAMIQAYAWVLAVVGALICIVAIGAIVYRLRKPKAPAWE